MSQEGKEHMLVLSWHLPVESTPALSTIPGVAMTQEERLHQKITALLHCASGKHLWTPAGTDGTLVCSVCNALAYCPVCIPDLPPTVQLVPCIAHQKRGNG